MIVEQINGNRSFDRISLDQNCLFSVDQKFHFQLIEFFETFQLIEKFDQVPKKNLQILETIHRYSLHLNGILYLSLKVIKA